MSKKQRPYRHTFVKKAPVSRARALAGLEHLEESHDATHQGPLHEGALIELLGGFWREHFCGVVVVVSGPTTRVIFLDAGLPVYAESNASRESLISLLSELNIVPVQDLDALTKHSTSQRASAQDEMDLGDVLIQRGWMDRARLDALLVEHAKRRIFGACQSVHGTFQVFSRRAGYDSCAPHILRLDALPILHTATRRAYDVNTLALALHAYTEHAPVPCEDFNDVAREFPWSPELLSWFASLDGATTLHAILQMQASSMASTLATLQTLHITRLIEFQPPASEPTHAIEVLHGVPRRVNIEQKHHETYPPPRESAARSDSFNTHGNLPRSTTSVRSVDPVVQELCERIDLYTRRLHEDSDYAFLGVSPNERSHQIREVAKQLAKDFEPSQVRSLPPVFQARSEKINRRIRVILARLEISQSRSIFGSVPEAAEPSKTPLEALRSLRAQNHTSRGGHLYPAPSSPRSASNTAPNPQSDATTSSSHRAGVDEHTRRALALSNALPHGTRDRVLWERLYAEMLRDDWKAARSVLKTLKSKGHKGADFEAEVAWVSHHMPHVKRKLSPSNRIKRILKHRPKHLQSLYYLILISLDLGKMDRAERVLERALALYPNDPRLFALRDALGPSRDTGPVRIESDDRGIGVPSRSLWARLMTPQDD